MNQHELLTELDNWQPYENPNCWRGTMALIREAAAEIRRLSPQEIPPPTEEEWATVLDTVDRLGSSEAGL